MYVHPGECWVDKQRLESYPTSLCMRKDKWSKTKKGARRPRLIVNKVQLENDTSAEAQIVLPTAFQSGRIIIDLDGSDLHTVVQSEIHAAAQDSGEAGGRKGLIVNLEL